jgi:23S rRNA (guanosine2251-2'-O)-methyltransferase
LQRGGAARHAGEIKSLNVSNATVLALYVGATKLGLMG